MITSAQIQMIRNADPGATLPGIDTATGNPLSASSLMSYTKITQNPQGAPYFYEPANNEVIVTQNGAVLSGINFGTASLTINASNVTVKDCTFSATTGYWAVAQAATASGATVEDCTFQGSGSPTENNNWVVSSQAITIKDNTFLESPTDAIVVSAGVITGNYFSGAGFLAGAHSDAIYVTDSTGPVAITDNFIDGTYNSNAAANANSDIRLTTEFGNLSNVTVSGNFLLGAGITVEVVKASNSYTITNVAVLNNYIGFYLYGAYWYSNAADGATNYAGTPEAGDYATTTGNTIVTYANPVSSSQALAAYEKTTIRPTNIIAATTAGQTLTSSAATPTTLLGKGLATTLWGSNNETNFVSGYGGHQLIAGLGANILTYLAISDSTPGLRDTVSDFDPAKDVIDLSRIDANITTPGLQHFTFIGTAPFSGNGAQVRYEFDPTRDLTYVEVDLASDSATDFEIALKGFVPLSASNFALTAAQSTSDIANGASLTEAKVQTASGALTEYAYSNVKGLSYSSYEAFYGSLNGFSVVAAEDLNLSSTADQLRLYNSGLTVTRGGGAETIAATKGADPFTYHSVETIDATTSGSEQFVFGTGFGHETIQGFAASGTAPDSIRLSASSFSYLAAGMTQAQELAAVLANASSSPSGLTVADSYGDSLTLAGLSAATIAANPNAIQFT